MYNNEQYGNGNGSSYSIKDTATGLQRMPMTTAFWAMARGLKMLTEFGELGFDYSINWCAQWHGGCLGILSAHAPRGAIRWDYRHYESLLTNDHC